MLWKDKYELGVPLIDEQHKELFRRVEVFIQTVRSSAAWDEKIGKVNETLEFMKVYVVEHFNAEEGYQRSIEYPGYDMHKKIHDGMVSYGLSVSEEYEKSGCVEKLMLQFAGKLLAWLINHVAADDQNIASYAKEKGVDGNER